MEEEPPPGAERPAAPSPFPPQPQSPYGPSPFGPPVPGLGQPRPPVARKQPMPAWAKVAIILVVVIVLGSAGTAAYIVLGARSRFVGTWKMEKIETMGMTIEIDKFMSTFGSMLGAMGGTGAAASTPMEVLIELRRDGTGKSTSTGGLTSMFAAGGSASEDLKWSYQGGKITVESTSTSAGSSMGMMGPPSGTKLTGEIKQGKLVLSFEDPSMGATGSITCARKKK